MTPEANRLSRLARSMLNAIKSGDASADEVSEHLLKLQDLLCLRLAEMGSLMLLILLAFPLGIVQSVMGYLSLRVFEKIRSTLIQARFRS